MAALPTIAEGGEAAEEATSQLEQIPEGSKAWVPASATQLVFAIPKEFEGGPDCRVAYLPVIVQKHDDGTGKAGGGGASFELEWDRRVVVKCPWIGSSGAGDDDVQRRAWPDDENKGPDQLEQLTATNTASCLYALGVRFAQEKYVASIGNNISIWTNPLHAQAHKKGYHSNEVKAMQVCLEYLRRVGAKSATPNTSSSRPPALDLHVYGIADKVRSLLLEHKSQQLVVFRGASGAGKSEAVKSFVQFLLYIESSAGKKVATTAAAAAAAAATAAVSSGGGGGVKARGAAAALSSSSSSSSIGSSSAAAANAAAAKQHPYYLSLGSHYNPFAPCPGFPLAQRVHAGLLIFDTFCSASTMTNPTSSRCIKRLRLLYNVDRAGGGGTLTNVEMSCLLLDTSRFGTAKGPLHRPLSIFPLMLAGLASDKLAALSLNSTSNDASSNIRGSYLPLGRAPLEEMASDFVALQDAILAAGVPPNTWQDALKCLAVIMHLQSISIQGSDSSTVIAASTKASLFCAEDLLGTEAGALMTLIEKKTDTGKLGAMDNTPIESKIVIDSLCAAIYMRTIAFLSAACLGRSFVIDALASGPLPPPPPLSPNTHAMELIDFPGFENASVDAPANLFLLCSNYADERLTCAFAQIAISKELAKYEAEGHSSTHTKLAQRKLAHTHTHTHNIYISYTHNHTRTHNKQAWCCTACPRQYSTHKHTPSTSTCLTSQEQGVA